MHSATQEFPGTLLHSKTTGHIFSPMARPRRSEPTRLALLETGATMLRDHGYHGTGLKELLDEVGVPKGSFYNYFESKEDFGAAVIRHAAEESWAVLDEAAKAADKDAVAALRRYFRRCIKDFDSNACCGGCLFGNISAEVEDSEACRTALTEAFQGIRERLGAMLEKGQAQGAVREDVAASELSEHLLDAWEGALLRMKIERTTRPLKQVVRRLLEEDFLA